MVIPQIDGTHHVFDLSLDGCNFMPINIDTFDTKAACTNGLQDWHGNATASSKPSSARFSLSPHSLRRNRSNMPTLRIARRLILGVHPANAMSGRVLADET